MGGEDAEVEASGRRRAAAEAIGGEDGEVECAGVCEVGGVEGRGV